MADPLRERVIKKKILYDGYGTNEEKKMVQVMKEVAKLYLGNLPEDEFQKLYSTASKNINNVLAGLDKALKISERCDKEMADIESAIELKEKQIAQAKAELSSLSLELVFVEKLRKISVYPDCSTTEALIESVSRRRDELLNQARKYRQQIVTIINSCKGLQQVLNDEEASDNDKIGEKHANEILDANENDIPMIEDPVKTDIPIIEYDDTSEPE